MPAGPGRAPGPGRCWCCRVTPRGSGCGPGSCARGRSTGPQGRPETGLAAVARRGPHPPAVGRGRRRLRDHPGPAHRRGHPGPRAPPARPPGRGKWLAASVAGDAAAGRGRSVRRGRPPRSGASDEVDRAGRREHRPDRPHPGAGSRPRHHRHHRLRPDPRQRAPAGRRLVLLPQGQPRRRHVGPGRIAALLDGGPGAAAAIAAGLREAAAPWAPPAADRRRDRRLPRGQSPVPGLSRALAAGWPIATGVIEGACRHLVKDRMDITGARWGVQTAEAILQLRALHRQRRLRRLLALAPATRTRTQPPAQLRPRRLTLTPKETHPCSIVVVSGPAPRRQDAIRCITGTTRPSRCPIEGTVILTV